MAIAEQFAGLEMDKLIGAPLSAASDASIRLANSTADFINKVGFDAGGKVRTVSFMYEKHSPNEDGSSSQDAMKVDVPMLAIVPIPNLQVDEVNILFDMEVKQSEKKDTSLDVGATLSGSVGFGPIKVSISGSVSVHSANTRSSDNSAKYHVDVRATNHGTPEGLARVLDMMAANVAPILVSSTLKDGNGQNLTENARIKAENLKKLRQEISQLEHRLTAAQNGLDSNIQQMKKIGTTQQNAYQAAMTRLTNALNMENETDNQKATAYSQIMDEINESWNHFQNQTGDTIKMISDSGNADDKKLSDLFAFKALKGEKAEVYETSESYYKTLLAAQNSAVTSQAVAKQIETELLNKKAEYNNAIAATSVSAKAAPAAITDGGTK